MPSISCGRNVIRRCRWWHALVVETSSESGGFVLGFRIDPYEKLADVYKEIKTLHEVFTSNPLFGVKYTVEEKTESIAERTVQRKMDDVEVFIRFDALSAQPVYIAPLLG